MNCFAVESYSICIIFKNCHASLLQPFVLNIPQKCRLAQTILITFVKFQLSTLTYAKRFIVLYCFTLSLSRARAQTLWFAFYSRHLHHLVVDSELDGCVGWNSSFLVSITWLNACNCKKNNQFGKRYAALYLKPSFLIALILKLPCKTKGYLVFVQSKNTPLTRSFSVSSEQFFLLKTSLAWDVSFFQQNPRKTLKPRWKLQGTDAWSRCSGH